MPKKALDQLQSPIIKSSYNQNDKLMSSSSFIIGPYEAIEYTTLGIPHQQMIVLYLVILNIVIQDQDSNPHSATKLPISQSEFHLKKKINNNSRFKWNFWKINGCSQIIQYLQQSWLCRQNYFTKSIYLEQLKQKILLNLSTQKKVRHISIFRIVKIYKFLKVLQQSHDKEMIQLMSQLVQLLYMENITIQKINPRFNANNKMILLPPIQILHIPNLKKVSFNAETMQKSFQNMVLLKYFEKQSIGCQSRINVLIKMETIKQALKIMALMLMEEVDHIQISFTKAKI
ncbi:unnamed protein product [Paramecium primaurelia]|uniref:Uncharacterized protein n=1 Tax=Paramecium primaurelia TaxID=5886 RepID=A0A8S1L208_PARPR|nr:unnamed protein product [Paramecium primaurelia]